MQATIAIRIPCPVVQVRGILLHLSLCARCVANDLPLQTSRTFQGLYYSYSSPTPSQVKVHTVFPPQENTFAKRFPMFEAIMGTTHPIHECLVRVPSPKGPIAFLVAYQERPNLQPNHAFFPLVPNVQLCGEILVVRSGEGVLVTTMGGRLAIEAAKEAVRA